MYNKVYSILFYSNSYVCQYNAQTSWWYNVYFLSQLTYTYIFIHPVPNSNTKRMVGARRSRDSSFRSDCNKGGLIYLPRLVRNINIQLLLLTRKKRRDVFFFDSVANCLTRWVLMALRNLLSTSIYYCRSSFLLFMVVLRFGWFVFNL